VKLQQALGLHRKLPGDIFPTRSACWLSVASIGPGRVDYTIGSGNQLHVVSEKAASGGIHCKD